MNELQDFFAQGDADLRATAGQPAVLVRRATGERVPLSVVSNPAALGLDIPTLGGAIVTCDHTVVISRSECSRRPSPGDTLEMDGQLYELLRVTGWAYDTSWHADVALRRR